MVDATGPGQVIDQGDADAVLDAGVRVEELQLEENDSKRTVFLSVRLSCPSGSTPLVSLMSLSLGAMKSSVQRLAA
jgi:hypothetical protein